MSWRQYMPGVRVPGPLDSLLLFLEGEEEKERKQEPEEKVEMLFQVRQVGVICPTAVLSLLGSLGAGQLLITS